MGLHTLDLRGQVILLQRRTIGGDTYFVAGKPKCLCHLREAGHQDQYCSRVAGHATDHKGTGRCKYHAGRATKPATHGRYSRVGKQRLQQTYERYAEDPTLLDLKPELVLQRTLLDQYMAQVDGNGFYSQDQVAFIYDVIEHIGRTVERIDKVESKQVLTVAAYRYAMSLAINVMKRFLPESQWVGFVDAWEREVMSLFQGKELDLLGGTEERALTVLEGRG